MSKGSSSSTACEFVKANRIHLPREAELKELLI
jgi:hypothetical protein